MTYTPARPDPKATPVRINLLSDTQTRPTPAMREATAAVGRGELNVRVLATDTQDTTFRKDELGDLARDFDEMTRQLQKNVNQLARSNEAKRRFSRSPSFRNLWFDSFGRGLRLCLCGKSTTAQ